MVQNCIEYQIICSINRGERPRKGLFSLPFNFHIHKLVSGVDINTLSINQSQSQLSKDRGQPDQMGVATTPKYNLALAIMWLMPHIAVKGAKWVWGFAPRKNFYKCIPYDAGKCPFASIIKLASQNLNLWPLTEV